ncbi:hypothetical protein HBI56_196510 [Parastagonospora nodorum]|nr:hypothetical protein HBI10_217370 [Parastagonospora nodorum]KAH4010220.1 hypothetical protein HBI13_211030 [Parastagonospora nodorum]KAH4016356.1 hypothetical protein HBI09_202150 [Parastagonospora nodorum]KAH4114647.1 hypothetical protein HBH47_191690 [Parastagonospora nodorum]KAH4252855.1 hypothetical protein HBI03_202620 [Parastagonospora nodorum]
MKVTKHIYVPLALIATLTTSSLVTGSSLSRRPLLGRDGTDSSPLLTAISNDPDLSTFYSLIKSTGGTSGIPAPSFEERFNNLTDGRKFTAFAPVNSAFQTLKPEVLAALTEPASYVLLEAILRAHIAEGEVTTEDVLASGKSVKAIEGIPLTFSNANNTVTINNQTSLASTSRTVVGNGAIFKINKLIDLLALIYGTDVDVNTPIGSTSQPPKETSEGSGTIASILTSSPNLSTFTSLLNLTSPDFFYFLDAIVPDGKTLSIFAPSNGVFEAIGLTDKVVQPSNDPFTSYLLKYPFIDTSTPGQDKSIVKFPATVRRDEGGNITSVNNAAVKGEKTCVKNACIYTVDRWLDPMFGSF